MKEINYGMQMRDKEKLAYLIDVLKQFIKAAAEKNMDTFFTQRGEPSNNTPENSMNQTSQSNSSPSSGDQPRNEEQKNTDDVARSGVNEEAQVLPMNADDDSQLRQENDET